MGSLMEDADADADEDEDFSFSSDDDMMPDASDGDGDSDGDDFGASGGKKDNKRSLFAAAEEFAELLQDAGSDGKGKKQAAWEKQQEHQQKQSMPRMGHKRKGDKRKGG